MWITNYLITCNKKEIYKSIQFFAVFLQFSFFKFNFCHLFVIVVDFLLDYIPEYFPMLVQSYTLSPLNL